MNGIPPQFIALFCIMFIALIGFNALIAQRRRRRDGLQRQQVPWYKQTTILTFVEYVLLASVFLLNVLISYRILPTNLDGVVFPLFVALIFASGLLAGYIIFLLFRRASQSRTGTAPAQLSTTRTSNSQVLTTSTSTMSAEERNAYAQRRRDRRQKAAVARRRKAGKA